MGKKDKEHRKKVQKRNQQIRQDEKAIIHLREQIFKEAKARYESEQSTKTTNQLWNIL